MKASIEEIKNKYDEGYRCICKESKTQGCTYHLKDFYREKIYTVTTKNDMEIGEIDHFLDALDVIKKKQGHDCFCTGYDCD